MSLNIYQLFQTRYNLHKDVYNHPVVKGVEYMLTDILALADPIIKFSEMASSIDGFCKLTDDIISIIAFSDDPKLSPAQKLISRLQKRDIYRFIGSIQVPEDITEDFNSIDLLKFSVQGIIDKKDIIVQNMIIGYTGNKENPVDSVGFYKTSEPEKSFRIPKKNVSLLLPENFSEKIVRVFTRSNDFEVITEIKKLFGEFEESIKSTKIEAK